MVTNIVRSVFLSGLLLSVAPAMAGEQVSQPGYFANIKAKLAAKAYAAKKNIDGRVSGYLGDRTVQGLYNKLPEPLKGQDNLETGLRLGAAALVTFLVLKSAFAGKFNRLISGLVGHGLNAFGIKVEIDKEDITAEAKKDAAYVDGMKDSLLSQFKNGFGALLGTDSKVDKKSEEALNA